MQVLSEGCLPCCIYGGEHLLRLLLKLPDILAGLPHARLQVLNNPGHDPRSVPGQQC